MPNELKTVLCSLIPVWHGTPCQKCFWGLFGTEVPPCQIDLARNSVPNSCRFGMEFRAKPKSSWKLNFGHSDASFGTEIPCQTLQFQKAPIFPCQPVPNRAAKEECCPSGPGRATPSWNLPQFPQRGPLLTATSITLKRAFRHLGSTGTESAELGK